VDLGLVGPKPSVRVLYLIIAYQLSELHIVLLEKILAVILGDNPVILQYHILAEPP